MNEIIFAERMKNYEYTEERQLKCFEIIAAETNGKVDTETNSVEFFAGQTVIIPPNLKHRFTLYSGLDKGGLVCALLDKALLSLKDITVISDDENRGIIHAVGQAAYYLGCNLPKKEVVLSALGELLAGYITAFTATTEFSPVVAAVRAEIAKNVSDPYFSLKDALKKLPLNYDYVRKLFKKETGASPHEYLLKLKMQLAADLLTSGITNRYSGYTIAQAAEACGFSEPLYFSRVFKNYFGVTPSLYGK